MSKIHYFNPGHETAVLIGKSNYTPPANVQRMIKELSYLPAWYADAGDFIFMEEKTAPCFLSSLPKEIAPFPTPLSQKELCDNKLSIPDLNAQPWGLSPQSIRLFNDLSKNCTSSLSVPIWKEEYFALNGRQTAVVCLNEIRKQVVDMEVPAAPQFCENIHEIETYQALHQVQLILKTPYSSSGRGLHWLREEKLTGEDLVWIKSALKKQGIVSIECALNKEQDFALEFYSDGKGSVRYEGLSVFGAENKGVYSGNTLGSQAYLSRYFIDNFKEGVFDRIKEATCAALQSIYGDVYTGYLGVDMLTYRKEDKSLHIHPCVEINMRYTMGLVAIRISQKFIAPNAQGYMRIAYESKPDKAYEHDCFMKKTYPLRIADGKIQEGYLSLCPVTNDTHYRAYIHILKPS